MQLEVGTIVEGTVSGVKKFGAFVTLPEGKTGMVHISEVSNEFIQDLSAVLSEGQTVKVKIINIAEDGKIALSIKRTLPRSLSLTRAFGKPLVSSVIMGLAVWSCYGLSSSVLGGMSAFQNAAGALSNSGNAICTLFSVGVGGLVYLALVVLLRAISPQDLKFMPKGDKIGRLLRITAAQ